MTDTKHETKLNASHTPGPWEVSGTGIWATSPWNARFRLATVTAPSPMNGIDWQANARLIAAAPTLLEALTDLLNMTELNLDEMEDGTVKAIRRAHAVLAEVKGLAA